MFPDGINRRLNVSFLLHSLNTRLHSCATVSLVSSPLLPRRIIARLGRYQCPALTVFPEPRRGMYIIGHFRGIPRALLLHAAAYCDIPRHIAAAHGICRGTTAAARPTTGSTPRSAACHGTARDQPRHDTVSVAPRLATGTAATPAVSIAVSSSSSSVASPTETSEESPVVFTAAGIAASKPRGKTRGKTRGKSRGVYRGKTRGKTRGIYRGVYRGTTRGRQRSNPHRKRPLGGTAARSAKTHAKTGAETTHGKAR